MKNCIIYRATIYDSVGVPAASLVGDIDYLRESIQQSLDYCPFNYHEKLLGGKVIVDLPTLVINDNVVPVNLSKKSSSVDILLRAFVSNDFSSSSLGDMFVHMNNAFENYFKESSHE